MTMEAPQQPQSELVAMAQSIVADQRRIAQVSSPDALAAEMSGTVLAYQRDLAGYLARFEESVISNFNAVFALVGQLQEAGVGGAPAEDDQTTQFEPDDAAKFIDFIEGAKVLIAATKDAPGTMEPVKSQMAKMLVVADELLQLVNDGTLVDEEEVEEGAQA